VRTVRKQRVRRFQREGESGILSGQETCRAGCDAFVGCGEGDAYVPGRGVAVEVAGCNQDAHPGQVVDRNVAVLITSRPQLDGALGVCNAEAGRLQCWSQHRPAPEIPCPLQLNVIMITEQLDHRLLNRARYQHAGVLAHR
jgi:hypothetical protein